MKCHFSRTFSKLVDYTYHCVVNFSRTSFIDLLAVSRFINITVINVIKVSSAFQRSNCILGFHGSEFRSAFPRWSRIKTVNQSGYQGWDWNYELSYESQPERCLITNDPCYSVSSIQVSHFSPSRTMKLLWLREDDARANVHTWNNDSCTSIQNSYRMKVRSTVGMQATWKQTINAMQRSRRTRMRGFA